MSTDVETRIVVTDIGDRWRHDCPTCGTWHTIVGFSGGATANPCRKDRARAPQLRFERVTLRELVRRAIECLPQLTDDQLASLLPAARELDRIITSASERHAAATSL